MAWGSGDPCRKGGTAAFARKVAFLYRCLLKEGGFDLKIIIRPAKMEHLGEGGFTTANPEPIVRDVL